MRHLSRVSIIALALAAVSAPAHAQGGQDWLRIRLGQNLRPDVTWDVVWPALLNIYRSSNPDARGVSQKGIDQLRLIAAAQRRGQIYAMVHAQDLDGDGEVTREELLAHFQPRARRALHANGVALEPTEEQVRQQLDRLVGDALKLDTDRDGRITAAEAKREAETRGEEAARSLNVSQVVPLGLDADGDGFISRAEFEGAAKREFASADSDRDGRVSATELTAFQRLVAEARRAETEAAQERIRRAQFEVLVRTCEAEKPPAGMKLVLLGGYEGRALSNVSIGGEDREVSVANVEVAPGAEPIFIVATSHDAMIWRFTGATERVAGFLAHSTAGDPGSQRPRVGASGLPSDRVRFTRRWSCLPYFTDRDYGQGVLPIELLFGKRPDETVGVQVVHTMRVPDARHETTTPAALAGVALPNEGAAAPVWRDMERFYPAGLARIDPASVVAPLPVKRYEILPQQAGLAQLVEEGALKIVGTSRSVTVPPGGGEPTIAERPNAFMIVRKMRFPAGLTGAHAVRFILARGIDMPEGDPGQSCVIAEDDGQRIAGRPGCR